MLFSIDGLVTMLSSGFLVKPQVKLIPKAVSGHVSIFSASLRWM
jgi:hypothetical protein